jgi:hypothetical protein
LCGAPSDELHALGNDVWPGVFDEEMNVVTCHYVIEHAKSEALLGLEKPVEITATVPRKRFLTEAFGLTA